MFGERPVTASLSAVQRLDRSFGGLRSGEPGQHKNDRKTDLQELKHQLSVIWGVLIKWNFGRALLKRVQTMCEIFSVLIFMNFHAFSITGIKTKPEIW